MVVESPPPSVSNLILPLLMVAPLRLNEWLVDTSENHKGHLTLSSRKIEYGPMTEIEEVEEWNEEDDTAIQILIDYLEVGPIAFARTIDISYQALYNLRKGYSMASWETWRNIKNQYRRALEECDFVAADFMQRYEDD